MRIGISGEAIMPTIEVWVVLSEDGGYEAATDEDVALDRLKDGSSEDLTGTACRVVKLNVTMADPHYPDDDDEKAKPVKAADVSVPDGAGCVIEL